MYEKKFHIWKDCQKKPIFSYVKEITKIEAEKESRRYYQDYPRISIWIEKIRRIFSNQQSRRN